jgi:hypothetical protein
MGQAVQRADLVTGIQCTVGRVGLGQHFVVRAPRDDRVERGVERIDPREARGHDLS